MHKGEQGQRTTHAKASDPNFAGAALQVLHSPANILRSCVREVQLRHQVMRFLSLDRQYAAIKVGHERSITGARQSLSDAADLFVEASPFLDDYNCRRSGCVLWLGQVALNHLSIRALEGHCLCHV
jgi:hypothetical protein